jgi:hypothetical protein
MKNLKRHELRSWIRDKPYLYTIVGLTMIILSPLIFLISAVHYLKEEGFFGDIIDWYYRMIRLSLMRVEGSE